MRGFGVSSEMTPPLYVKLLKSLCFSKYYSSMFVDVDIVTYSLQIFTYMNIYIYIGYASSNPRIRISWINDHALHSEDICSNVVGKVVDVRLPTDDHFLTFLGDPVLHQYSY